jgi:hypothetical protein
MNMEEHNVKFHIGTAVVVCTCGEYFATGPALSAVNPGPNAVQKWANHVEQEM